MRPRKVGNVELLPRHVRPLVLRAWWAPVFLAGTALSCYAQGGHQPPLGGGQVDPLDMADAFSDYAGGLSGALPIAPDTVATAIVAVGAVVLAIVFLWSFGFRLSKRLPAYLLKAATSDTAFELWYGERRQAADIMGRTDAIGIRANENESKREWLLGRLSAASPRQQDRIMRQIGRINNNDEHLMRLAKHYGGRAAHRVDSSASFRRRRRNRSASFV